MSDVVCPHCQQTIYDDEALLCHFCGGSLERSSAGGIGKITNARTKWIFISIVLMLLASILLLWR